jgi:hypothetical protein
MITPVCFAAFGIKIAYNFIRRYNGQKTILYRAFFADYPAPAKEFEEIFTKRFYALSVLVFLWYKDLPT